MPRLLSSSSPMSWHALIFGAPESVPAGSTASIASSADSDPEKEFQECINKAKASLKALEVSQEVEE